MRDDTFEGDSKSLFDNINPKDTVRGIKFRLLPDILTFNLKRWKYDSKKMDTIKST